MTKALKPLSEKRAFNRLAKELKRERKKAQPAPKKEEKKMNERILKLAEQAKAESSQWLGSKPATTITYDELEKFAELIIQECLNICEDMGDNGKDGHYCADKITKTFRS